MKYFITGGCGFLGSNLAAEAMKNKQELVVFDNLSRVGSEINLEWLRSNGSFRFIHGDIRNYNDIEHAVIAENPDVIFHLAGQVTMTISIQNPRKDFEINALGTFNLLEAARRYAPNAAIIYSSTNKVYGDLEWLEYEETEERYNVKKYPNGLPESIPLNFASPYGCSKGSADQYMLDYHRILGLKTVVFRHSSMYGGRQFSTYDQGWIGWFCEQAIRSKIDPPHSFTISGNGKQVRDVLYADDMVSLYFGAVRNIDKIKGMVFNVGGGINNSLSLLELFGILEKELNVKLNFDNLPSRESDQKFFVADIAKAEKLIGWRPVVDKFSGIRRMLGWIKDKNNKS